MNVNVTAIRQSVAIPASTFPEGRAKGRSLQVGRLYMSCMYEITREDVFRWCLENGDRNPIHYDEEFAARFGHDAPIIPGLMLAGRLSGFASSDVIGDGGHALTGTLRARKPVLVDSFIRFALQIKGVKHMPKRGTRVVFDSSVFTGSGKGRRVRVLDIIDNQVFIPKSKEAS